jgi:dihydroxy-acid dehydratase
LDVKVSADEISDRLKKWSAPALKYKTGILNRYAKLVQSASTGAVLK